MHDRKKWEDDEEAALAQAWIDSSEDSVLGDAKRSAIYWAEIREKFFEIMGRGHYRGDDSVSNKWKAMVLKMNHFSMIHTLRKNNRPSGTNDANLLEAMLKQYKGLHGHHFGMGMFEIWKKCTSSPKWHPIPTSSPRPFKRSKTTSTSADQSSSQAGSDARSQFNLNEIDPEFVFDESDELPRPIGRNKAKEAVRGGGSSSITTSTMSSDMSARFDNLKLALKEFREENKNTRKRNSR
ncbi:glutathione S-transferase T3-like [Bidens hawaiensis]|uniref:glutathione S-transferase T3-like n=1 Tax=Bidens hawaiensis TaxID=980011 RepID=UPI00404ACF23